MIAANLDVKKLGSANPVILVPLIRSCVAQAVGAIMVGFMSHIIQVLSACASEGMSIAEKAAVIQTVVEELKKDRN